MKRIKLSPRKRQIADYYNKTAFEYEKVLGVNKHMGLHFGYYDEYHKTQAEAVINTNKILAKLAGIRSDMKILDAGCGVGGSAIWLAKKFGVSAVGINISEVQLEKARKYAKKNGVSDKVKFHLMDFTKTGFDNGLFDIVWSIESVCHADNKLDFLKEAYRVLKKGGKLIISDGYQYKKKLTGDEHEIMERWTKGWGVNNLSKDFEFEKQMKKVGFKNIYKKRVDKLTMPFSIWLYKRVTLLRPLGILLHKIGILSDMRAENGWAAIYQYEARKKGLWGHMIFRGEK